MWGSPSCYTHSCRRTPYLHASIVPYPFLFPLYPSTFLPFSPISSPAYPPNTPPLAPLALQPPYPAAGPHDGGKNSSFHQSVNGGGRGRRQGWAPSARKGPLGNVGSWSPPCSVIQLLRWVTSVSGSIIPNIHREPAAAKQCDTALKR